MIPNKKQELKMNIRPSLRRILDMDNKTILANYSLIVYKASSLSSEQRRLVQQVLQARLNHEVIKDDEVAEEVAKLGSLIRESTLEALKKERSDELKEKE
jgi:hypothetical protein